MLGIGNPFLGDLGLGVHAVRELGRRAVPVSVELFEVGTALFDFHYLFETAENIVIIDAVESGQLPGTVTRTAVNLDHTPSAPSVHTFEILRAIEIVRPPRLPDVVVYAIEVHSIEVTCSLSRRVTAALPELLMSVEQELLECACTTRMSYFASQESNRL